MKTNKLLIIDLECTCWETKEEQGLQFQEIIEIGYSIIDTQKLEFINNDCIIVKPQLSRVSDFCTKLTSLTQEYVEKGVSLAVACEILKKNLHSKSMPWASWGDFDKIAFSKECEQKSIEYPFSKRHLNLKLMTALFNGWEKELGMKEALEKVRLPMVGIHHRGKDDAYNIANIFLELK